MSGGDEEARDALLRDAAADWFGRLRSDDCTEEDRASFAAWRDADPAHEATYDRLARVWDQYAFVGNTPTAQARKLGAAFSSRRVQPRFAIAAGLAAVLLAAVAGVGLQQDWAGDASVQQRIELADRAGEIRAMRLPDGSVVTLDAGAIARLEFSATGRNIFLTRGRARFDVKPDPARPFVVTAGGRTVTAVGTVFDVSTSSAGVTIILLEGAVEVRSTGTGAEPAAARPAVRLAAGQQITIPPSAAMLPGAQRLKEAQLRWPSGLLSFDETRLADAVAQVNRHSRAKIILGSPDLAALRVTGTFRANDPAGFAAAVAKIFGLGVQTDRHGNSVLSAAAD